MKYSVVIPTYNNCDKYLKPCIESIIKYTNLNDIELIVSANGCIDETDVYLTYLNHIIPNLVVIWNKEPIGFSKAINEGINKSSTNKIIILNNDTILLEQPKNKWLEMLDGQGDINAPLHLYSKITQQTFAVFFCVLINKKVFDQIGLLPIYDVGGCEDIEFCYKATQAGFTLINCGYNNTFPIYHVGEGTMNDEKLVSNWKRKFYENELILSKKYNKEHYKYLLSNNYERAVFLKGDPIFPREAKRYLWARHNAFGETYLEIGCSTGYGTQFFNDDISYIGVDYDPIIIDVAKEQNWGQTKNFMQGDINNFPLAYQDTIIAFEVIEHLDNGLEIVEMLKTYCKTLLISVPYNEPKGFWGEHHKLHGLTEKDFPNFNFSYIDESGNLSNELNLNSQFSLMLCRWENA